MPSTRKDDPVGAYLEQQNLPDAEPELLDVGHVVLHQCATASLSEVPHQHVGVEGIEVEAVPGVTLTPQLCREAAVRFLSLLPAVCRVRTRSYHVGPLTTDHRRTKVEIRQLREVSRDHGVDGEEDRA